MDRKRIKYLITNLFTGSSSMSERAEMAKWINSEEAEQTSKEVWESVSNDIDNTIKKNIWNNIQSHLKSEPNDISIPKCIHKHKSHYILKIVAFIAVILCSTFISLILLYNNHFIGNKESAKNNIYSFEVASGQKGHIRLADGTVVYLNSASKISFTGDYNLEKRTIDLDGEAYFEVAKNPDKKFIVSCNGIEVEALGTEFNVKAYSTDSIITTTLAKGKVKVYSEKQSITLYPKDVATYNLKRQTIKSSTVDDISVADYWRSGQLIFDAEPLSSIAQTMERMYNVKINIKDERLKNMKFTGTIQNNSLNNVMHIISLSYPLMYTITDSIIIISTQNKELKNYNSKKQSANI